MKQAERASFVRVISDVIKADGIIDTREIDAFDEVKEKYKIKKEDELLAETFTLSKALSVLSSLDSSTKHSLMNEVNYVAMSDNFCAKEEALLLMGVRLMLTLSKVADVSVLSIESSVLSFDDAQILYLESEYDEKVNDEMCRLYREISSEARISGFELVYLPEMSRHYNSIADADFLRIAKFLYPKVSDERIGIVIEQMQSLSTASFCVEQLANKLSLKELKDIPPTFLIKIGGSRVNDKYFSNFLLVGIDDSPLATIRKFMDLYAELYRNLRLNYIQEEAGRFIFTGYYKHIFDVLMLRKGVKSSVVVDPVRERIFFPEADAKLEKTHRREKALYALFLMESVGGGISFKLPETLRQKEKYEKRMRALKLKYQKIYVLFGGNADRVPDIENPEIRRPMISLLNKSLSNLQGILYNVEDYTIQRNIYGNYAVGIPASLCYCCNPDVDGLKLITESDEWMKISVL